MAALAHPLIAAWPLTLLAWPFALAALAAIIPIVLHLIHHQKARQVPFPTLRFLRVSVEKTRRRKRVQDLLLMLIRAAALVLIALGLARPTITHLHSLMGVGSSAVVIVLDNSASMGAIDQEQSRLELAVGAASQILDELGDGDGVALLVTGGPPFPELGRLDSTQEKVRQVLPQCRVSYTRADLGAKVRQARKLLVESDAPNKQVYVLTDMQQRSWDSLKRLAAPDVEPEKGSTREGETPAAAAVGLDIPVILVDCSRVAMPNVAVQGVEIKAPVPVAGLPIAVGVDLWNTSERPEERSMEMVIDDVKEQTSPALNLPARGHVKHDFSVTFRQGGLHRGEVRLVGQDGLKLDDRRFFALDVDQGIPVAVVKPRRHEIAYLEETFYLERALSPGKTGGSAIAVTPLVAEDLRTEALERYKVIFCVNLPAPDAETAQRLGSYVAAGGKLVWIAGDHVDPEAYNRMNASAKGSLLPASLVDVRTAQATPGHESWHVDFLDARHPALGSLVDPPKLYQSILVFKHVRMAVDRMPDAWVLARLDDGEPLLIERRVQRGRVLMLGTGAHVGWSNLPLRPIFLPLLMRLTFALAGTEQAQHEVVAGTALVLPLESQASPVNMEIQRPNKAAVRLHTESEKDRKGQVFRYADTHDIGNYLLRSLDPDCPVQTVFSVNADPEETDPARIERDEIQERFDPTPLIFADDPTDLSAAFAQLREGKSLWGFFLWTVLAVLVLETFLSNRWSPKDRGFPSPSRSTMLEADSKGVAKS